MPHRITRELTSLDYSAGTRRRSFGPIFLRARLIYDERSSAELFAVQIFDRRAAFRFVDPSLFSLPYYFVREFDDSTSESTRTLNKL
jgi:hypothetical protein